jgi:hypothetical protein
MLYGMYRRVLTLALRLAAYLALVAVGLVLASRGWCAGGFVVAAVGVAVWMGSGSLAHHRRLASWLAEHPARAGAILIALALLAVMWWPVLGIYAVAALVIAMDALQDGLRIAAHSHRCAVPLIRLSPLTSAAPRGVTPLPASPIPIFSHA